MASLLLVEQEEEDWSSSISNLLSDHQDTWLPSLTKLRILGVAHFENLQHGLFGSITENEKLLGKLESFLLPTSDPTLRLEASIIYVLISVNPKGTTDLINILIDSLTIIEDKLMIISILLALGVLASSKPSRRNKIISNNILKVIQTRHTAAQGDIDIIRAIMRTLSHICEKEGDDSMPLPLTILPLLSASLHSSDVKTISYAAYAVSSLLEEQSEEVLSADRTIAPTLTQLMLHPAKEVVTPALRGVGNIMTGDDQQTQRMINLQVIPSLLWLVEYPDKEVQKEAVWTLSNIAAGTHEQIQAVIDAGVIPKIIPLLENWKKETKAEKDLFKEAVWLLGNICEAGSSSQKRFMLNEKMLERFYELLKHHTQLFEFDILGTCVQVTHSLFDAVINYTENDMTGFIKENNVIEFIQSLKEISEYSDISFDPLLDSAYTLLGDEAPSLLF